MSPRARVRLVLGLAVLGAATACVVDPLNPQPLPPQNPDNDAVYKPDASFVSTSDGGSKGGNADAGELNNSSDAGAEPPSPLDGGDAGDAGDGGDAGDAGHS